MAWTVILSEHPINKDKKVTDRYVKCYHCGHEYLLDLLDGEEDTYA